MKGRVTSARGRFEPARRAGAWTVRSVRVAACAALLATCALARAATSTVPPASSAPTSAPAKPKTSTTTAAPAKPKTGTTTTTPRPKPQVVVPKNIADEIAGKSNLEIATDARTLEDLGAYGHSADLLRVVRQRAARDADLDLALAFNEARSGSLDSAATLLWGPVLTAALADSSIPRARRIPYAWHREPLFVNGTWDGWYWYIARARAEVAARLGRWADALAAARLSARARTNSGKEWLILGLCEARAGSANSAEDDVRRAITLDPTLPEAHYLAGLFEWRAGRRNRAQDHFRDAVALDSSYREPAIALMRSRLPVPPDTLPAAFLTGVREIALLCSNARPKHEEFVQMDVPALLERRLDVPIADSLKTGWKQFGAEPSVLIDERGRIVLNEFPWAPPNDVVPDGVIGTEVGTLPHWHFTPATRNGTPSRVWASVQLLYTP
jgi:tetratricopeptide (TPR) repeat protein